MTDKTDKTTEEEEAEEARAQLPTSDADDTVIEKASGAAGTDQSQDIADDETKKGYRGVSPDPNPDEYYTVKGVLKRAKEQK